MVQRIVIYILLLLIFLINVDISLDLVAKIKSPCWPFS